MILITLILIGIIMILFIGEQVFIWDIAGGLRIIIIIMVGIITQIITGDIIMATTMVTGMVTMMDIIIMILITTIAMITMDTIMDIEALQVEMATEDFVQMELL